MIDLYRKVRAVSGTTERYKRDAIGLFCCRSIARFFVALRAQSAGGDRLHQSNGSGQEFVKRNPEILLKKDPAITSANHLIFSLSLRSLRAPRIRYSI